MSGLSFVLSFLLVPVLAGSLSAADLVAHEPTVSLHERAAAESEVITVVRKGEKLTPIASTAGTADLWYFVRTATGLQGWVNSKHVSGVEELEKEIKKRKPPSSGLPERSSYSSGATGITSVPVQLNGAAIFVPVKLNGSVRARMLMDTGASYTVVTPRLAKRLRLRKGGAIKLMTANGLVSAPLARLSSLQVGEAEARDLTVAIHQFAPGSGIGGLLGLNFFSQFHTTVDPKKKRLLLEPK